ncbi:hypothetical protein OED52_07370 [Rhodococcus sp. Z13]|uniref:Uncharacterized protein n=1 Tax=Rhodococcus sacchari TaxID=2962047 RepID=A0ACD4DJZ4_9NOCA|nr:hypothetical protein [Rhodococcus sp. Z13]UYP20345.1 hypothetical protein OED52_07370 [Rhodococcus sp. Z13]
MTNPDRPEHDQPLPAMPDPTAPMRTAVRYGVFGLIALAVVSSVISVIVAGTPGLWGALIGAAVGGGFILFTALGVLLTSKMPAMTAGAVLLGTWLLKLILAIVVMGSLDSMDFYSRNALVLTIVFALVIVLGAETYGVLSTRALYIDAQSSDGAENDER